MASWLVRGLGIALAASAVPCLLFLPEPAGGVLALGMSAVGMYVAVVVADPAVPASAAQAALLGEAEALRSLASALHLEGVPHAVPAADGRCHLFLPARAETGSVPAPESGSLHGGQDGHMAGVSVATSATHLVHAQGGERGRLRAAGLQEGLGVLREAGREADLWHRLDVRPDADALAVSFRTGCVKPPCQGTTVGCVPSGCMLCHSVAMGVAESLDAPVRLASGTAQGRWVRLKLERVTE